jgi:hypothetical protein
VPTQSIATKPAEYGRPQSVRDADLLREQAAFEKRVLREGYGVEPPAIAEIDALRAPITVEEIETVVNEIEADPRRIAERLLTLERAGKLARIQLEALELRMIAGGGVE